MRAYPGEPAALSSRLSLEAAGEGRAPAASSTPPASSRSPTGPRASSISTSRHAIAVCQASGSPGPFVVLLLWSGSEPVTSSSATSASTCPAESSRCRTVRVVWSRAMGRSGSPPVCSDTRPASSAGTPSVPGRELEMPSGVGAADTPPQRDARGRQALPGGVVVDGGQVVGARAGDSRDAGHRRKVRQHETGIDRVLALDLEGAVGGGHATDPTARPAGNAPRVLPAGPDHWTDTVTVGYPVAPF